MELFCNSTAHNCEIYFCTLRPTKASHNLFTAHLHTCNRRIVDSNDTVTGKDSDLLRRTFGHRLDDEERVFLHIELYANAIERTIERLIHRLRLLGSGIGGMRIKLLKHAAYAVLNKFLLVHRIDIEVTDCDLRNLKFS